MRATTRRGDRKKYSRARMRRAARASDRTRVVEAVETPIPRMHDVVAPPFQKSSTKEIHRARRHTPPRVDVPRGGGDARANVPRRTVAAVVSAASLASLARAKTTTREHTPCPSPSRRRRGYRRRSRARDAMATTTTSSCSTPTLTSTREDAKATRRAMGGMMMTPTPTRRNRPAAAASRRR